MVYYDFGNSKHMLTLSKTHRNEKGGGGGGGALLPPRSQKSNPQPLKTDSPESCFIIKAID